MHSLNYHRLRDESAMRQCGNRTIAVQSESQRCWRPKSLRRLSATCSRRALSCPYLNYQGLILKASVGHTKLGCRAGLTYPAIAQAKGVNVEEIRRRWFLLRAGKKRNLLVEALKTRCLEISVPAADWHRRWSDRIKVGGTSPFCACIFCRFSQVQGRFVLETLELSRECGVPDDETGHLRGSTGDAIYGAAEAVSDFDCDDVDNQDGNGT